MDAIIVLGDFRMLSTWVLAVLAKVRGKKVLFWTMGWSRKEAFFVWKIRKLFYSLADVLLLYSQAGAKLAVEYGLSDKQIVVIGNSIYTRTQLQSKPDKVISTNRNRICVGAVARITQTKRFDLLLEAIAQLRAQGIDATARIAGDGEGVALLKELALELDVPAVFLGPIYDDQALSDYYASIDLAVIPTYAGLSIVQSMAHGVPVITGNDLSDQGPEVEAITDGINGFFVESNSPYSLASGIKHYLALATSKKEELSEQALFEITQHWTVEHQASRILDGLQQALET